MNVVQRSSVTIAVATAVTSILILSTGVSVAENDSGSLTITTNVDADGVISVSDDTDKNTITLGSVPPPPPGLFVKEEALGFAKKMVLTTNASPVTPDAPTQPSFQSEERPAPTLKKATEVSALMAPKQPKPVAQNVVINAPVSNMQAPRMMLNMPEQPIINKGWPVGVQKPEVPQNIQQAATPKGNNQNRSYFQQGYMFVPVPYLQGYNYQAPRRVYYAPPQMEMPKLNVPPQPIPPVKGSH